MTRHNPSQPRHLCLHCHSSLLAGLPIFTPTLLPGIPHLARGTFSNRNPTDTFCPKALQWLPIAFRIKFYWFAMVGPLWSDSDVSRILWHSPPTRIASSVPQKSCLLISCRKNQAHSTRGPLSLFPVWNILFLLAYSFWTLKSQCKYSQIVQFPPPFAPLFTDFALFRCCYLPILVGIHGTQQIFPSVYHPEHKRELISLASLWLTNTM